MAKRGNPLWCIPASLSVPPAGPSSFEQMASTLGLSPEQYPSSVLLRRWVEKNKNHKYVPTDLLKFWELVVDV